MTSNRKTQTELEQPAKVYQLDALEGKVNEVLDKLTTVINQTSGVVTQQQLVEAKKELKEYIDSSIKESEKHTGLKYDPMQSNLTWFIRLVIGQIVVVVGGAIVTAIIISNSGG